MKIKQTTMLNPQHVVRGDASVFVENPAEYTYFSEPNGGSCVGVYEFGDVVLIASTLTPNGDVQVFTKAEWEAILSNVREDASYANMLNVASDMFTKDELDSFAEGVRMGAFTLVNV